MPLTNNDLFIRVTPTKRSPSERTVTALTGLSVSTIYRLMARGAFPKGVPIAGARAVRWRLSDVRDWMEKQGVSQGK